MQDAAPEVYRLLATRRFTYGQRLIPAGSELHVAELNAACHFIRCKLARPLDQFTARETDLALALMAAIPPSPRTKPPFQSKPPHR